MQTLRSSDFTKPFIFRIDILNINITPRNVRLPKGPKSCTMPIKFLNFEQVQVIHFLLTDHQDVMSLQHSNWRDCWREKNQHFTLVII